VLRPCLIHRYPLCTLALAPRLEICQTGKQKSLPLLTYQVVATQAGAKPPREVIMSEDKEESPGSASKLPCIKDYVTITSPSLLKMGFQTR
jgi:hypothetical protein